MPRDIYHTEEKTFEKIDNGVNEKVKEDDHSLMLDVTGLQVTIMSKQWDKKCVTSMACIGKLLFRQ